MTKLSKSFILLHSIDIVQCHSPVSFPKIPVFLHQLFPYLFQCLHCSIKKKSTQQKIMRLKSNYLLICFQETAGKQHKFITNKIPNLFYFVLKATKDWIECDEETWILWELNSAKLSWLQIFWDSFLLAEQLNLTEMNFVLLLTIITNTNIMPFKIQVSTLGRKIDFQPRNYIRTPSSI